MTRWLLLCAIALDGCAGSSPTDLAAHRERPAIDGRTAGQLRGSMVWSRDTHSPNPASAPSHLQSYVAGCGDPDTRLGTVAEWLAEFGTGGNPGSDVDQLIFALRAAGTPYVRPAAWTRSWPNSQVDAELPLALDRWLGTLDRGLPLRCGVAQRTVRGRSVFVAVVATALADLVVPLPTQARVGQWIDFEANLLVEASQAKVVLLGPTGEPATIPTQQSDSIARARFAAASPGAWLVQLVATTATGPCPMAEAMIFVDVPPASRPIDAVVPGGSETLGGETAEAALNRMVAAMRRETGRQPMRRDSTLDRLAAAHADAMRRAHRVGHDVGDGPTHARLAEADFQARLAGENVAHAGDAARAHRALWASPSHRSNLLHRGFARWGLGVARDQDGTLWVCQLFASER